MSAVKTCCFAIVTLPAILALAMPVSAQYVEDFASTTYKDEGNTSAWWDTANGELKLHPFQLALIGSYDSPGGAESVAVAGDHAYLADGFSGLQVIDISNPAGPTLAGSYNTPGEAFDVAISGDLAFVADRTSGLQVIDISDPSAPTFVGSYNTPGGGWGVTVSGNHAFVADGTSGLQVIDISDPTNPTLAGTYDTPDRARGVAVAGDHAYVADENTGLLVIDITDPTSPTLAGSYAASDSRMVAVSGNHAYVADGLSGELKVIDITDPTAPTLAGSVAITGNAIDVAVSGDHAYVMANPNGLRAIDISDPTSPTVVESYITPGAATGVAVAGHHAFLSDTESGGLQVVQIAEPVLPLTLAGSIDTPHVAVDVVLSGDYAYVADSLSGLQVVDITDPTNPTLAGSYDTPDRAKRVAIAGNYAYVADSTSGLQIVDITNPAGPTLAGSYNTPGNALGVAVAGNYAYVADWGSGLQVIDISDPENPALAGTYNTPALAISVAIHGNYAIVGEEAAGFQVIDVSDPTSPTLVGSANISHSLEIVVSGDYAYVAGGFVGLQVVDISDPTNPTFAGFLGTPDEAVGIAVSGNYAYIGDRSSGLRMFDVSDPTSPTLVAVYNTPVRANGVAISDDYAYVTDNEGGLLVLQVSQRLVDPNGDVGQSTPVDGSDGVILRARLTTVQTGSIDWELSANGGGDWQPFPTDGSWIDFIFTGLDLLWRSTHVYTGGNANPTATSVSIEWQTLAEPPSLPDPPHDRRKNRYISFAPENAGEPVAFRVELIASLYHSGAVGLTTWVGAPDAEGISHLTDAPLTRIWDEPVIHATGCEIVPVADYQIRATGDDGGNFSAPLAIGTVPLPVSPAPPSPPRLWCDTVGHFNGVEWTPPDGHMGFDDVIAVLITFLNRGHDTAHTSVADLEPQVPNKTVNFDDVLTVIHAYNSLPYPFGCSAEPCRDKLTYGCGSNCTVPEDCDDGMFCNGMEACLHGICVPGAEPCPGPLCDEVGDVCDPCTTNGDCDDALFCNGPETCANTECQSGVDPCPGRGCDESSDECIIRAAYAWVPVEATGSHTVDGNEIILSGGDQAVTLELRLSGWGMANGSPLLGAYQATLDSSGYSSGAGDALSPLGWPDSPKEGAFVPTTRCTVGLQSPGTGDTCLLNEDCPGGEFCLNADYVFPYNSDDLPAIRVSSLDYAWASVTLDADVVVDLGIEYLGGILILEVPPSALGTYTIDFISSSLDTFVVDENSEPILPLALIPGQITVTPGPPAACCLPDESCSEETIFDCAVAGGAFKSGVLCDEDPCTPSPCCLPGGICSEEIPSDCAALGGTEVCTCLGDTDLNSIDDACECAFGNTCPAVDSPTPAPPPHDILKNRYLSVDRGNPGVAFFDIMLTLTDTLVGRVCTGDMATPCESDAECTGGPGGTCIDTVTAIGSSWWANAPDQDCVSVVGLTRPIEQPCGRTPDWSDCSTVHLTGCPIIPTSTYDIVVFDGTAVSDPPLSASTQAKPGVKWHGDCVGVFTGTEWTGPNFTTNIDDAVAAIKTFQNPTATPGCGAPPCNATHLSVTDMEPNLTPGPQINSVVNIADVFSIILGFQGLEYPGTNLTLCP